MKDLSTGPVSGHVVALAIPMFAGMLLQTLYFFVDLYFVARLGDAAIAGVAAGGNFMFIIFFLSQSLGVGTIAMVAQAVGRKDRDAANHAFNQAAGIGALFAVITLVGGLAAAGPYANFFGPDEAAREAGRSFLYWFIPSLALQFPIVVMGSGLRGTGIVKPAMAVQALTVLLNVILAPILVAGWLTGKPMGVAGAGLATTIAVAVGVVVMVIYFVKLEHYVAIEPAKWKPDWATWRRLFNIGLPAGGEFGIMAIFVAVLYWAARDFGTPAQGGLGIGFRVSQMIFIPALAIGFAAAPIAGQNYGARQWQRVRDTFFATATTCAIVMALIMVFAKLEAETMVRIFTHEPAVIAVAVEYIEWASWNFVPVGIVMCASGVMQGMGNTWPALGSSAMRIVTFALPTILMAGRPGFALRDVFALSLATILLQLVVSVAWLRHEFRKRLR
jgi:putative MATE family efflux protein